MHLPGEAWNCQASHEQLEDLEHQQCKVSSSGCELSEHCAKQSQIYQNMPKNIQQITILGIHSPLSTLSPLAAVAATLSRRIATKVPSLLPPVPAPTSLSPVPCPKFPVPILPPPRLEALHKSID